MTRARPAEPVVQHRALDEVGAVGVLLEPAEQCEEGAGPEEHVTVDAAHDVGVRFPKNEVPNTGAAVAPEGHVPQEWHLVVERLQAGGRAALRVVVDDQEGQIVQDLRVEQPNRLDREPDAIEVVEGSHTDAQPAVSLERRRLGNRTTSLLGHHQLLQKALCIGHQAPDPSPCVPFSPMAAPAPRARRVATSRDDSGREIDDEMSHCVPRRRPLVLPDRKREHRRARGRAPSIR